MSGFARSIPKFEFLDEFTSGGFDFEKIKVAAKERAVIAAKDDYIVPFALSRELASKIDAKFYEVQKGGHFLGADGFSEFELAYEILKKMTNKD